MEICEMLQRITMKLTLSQTGEKTSLSHHSSTSFAEFKGWYWLQCRRTSFAEFKGSLWLQCWNV